jgi:hypothetical protein
MNLRRWVLPVLISVSINCLLVIVAGWIMGGYVP